MTVSIAIALVLVASVGFFEFRKMYWDDQVREMCKRDGGVKVSETVTLDRVQYARLLNRFGEVSPPIDDQASPDILISHAIRSNYIRGADPEVRRDELTVIRRSDRKVLGTSVSYSRVGGDLFALHSSYFSCPESKTDLFSAVILQYRGQQ